MLALTGQGEVLWAVDTNHGSTALLIGLLLDREQPMVYLTGLALHHGRPAAGGSGIHGTETASHPTR
ncbi:hypothetical protein DMH25_44795 [Streptomyces sp. WAC 01325]|nr:hypothetical protein DMH25_44795 [Streptomyces sp. WAC 01325]